MRSSESRRTDPAARAGPAQPTAARIRFGIWTALVIALAAGQVLWLFLLRGERILHQDSILIGGQALLGLLAIGMLALLITTPPKAIRLQRGTSELIVIAVSILLQGAAVALLIPGLSDDLARYRLDGRMWLAGESPYAMTPAEFNRRHDPDPADALVSFPHLHTIYPSTAQMVFAAARALERLLAQDQHATLSAPGAWRQHVAGLSRIQQGVMLRLIFSAAAVVSTLLLLRILRGMGRSAWWAALFAWHPLVTLETAGMGHQDILGVLFVLASLRLAQRGRFDWSAATLALACGVKPFAVLLLPFLWRMSLSGEEGVNRQAKLTVLIWFSAAAALLYVPVMFYQTGYSGWLQTAHVFAGHWEANGSIYELWLWAFPGEHRPPLAKQTARLLALAALGITLLLLWRWRADVAESGYWMFLVLLLFAPVVYPWYLLWMLCLVPLLGDHGARRGVSGLAGMVWGATVAISYLLWRQPQWTLPAEWALLQYAPVYAALAVELTFRPARSR